MSALAPRPRRLIAAIAAIAAALVVAAGCSSGSGTGAVRATGHADDPQHVHGLGVNPADGSLLVATHAGLFRLAPGSDTASRVGSHREDLMGFVVEGPNRFLASGHPDLRDDLPPLLGLIASSDAGLSWGTISLTGGADFHALRASGRRVVGYDASGGRLMTSRDSGRTWRSSRPPEPLLDVAIDPDRPSRLVAAGMSGLLVSADGGGRWSRLGGSAMLLAWPVGEALFAVGHDGSVSVSRDGGRSWSQRASLPGSPAAVTAPSGRRLIVALEDGRLVSSDDAAGSWGPGAWTGA